MELKSITSIPNKYPETRDVKKSYTTDAGAITYSGKFEENKIEFSNQYWNLQKPYQVVPGTNFQFVIRFNDGEHYTSPSFNEKIQRIREEVNPYVTEQSLPIVLFDDLALKNYPIKREFDIGEKYAEAQITDTLNDKIDYIMHIDYLVTPDSGRSPLKQASEIGRWDLTTSDDLGMTYQPDIDDIESQEEDFSENQPSTEVYNPTIPPAASTGEAHQVVSNMKPPQSLTKTKQVQNTDGTISTITKSKAYKDATEYESTIYQDYSTFGQDNIDN